jgi:hypothetical protein
MTTSSSSLINYCSRGRVRTRLFLVVGNLMALGATLSGCAGDRLMPMAMMPTPPKECEQVLGFEVAPLPSGKSNAAALSVAMAKEGAARQQEHATSKVCAEYALRTAGVMKDKEAPASAKNGVEAAKAAPLTKGKGRTTAIETPAS